MRELVLAVAGKDGPLVIHFNRLLTAKTVVGPLKVAFLAAYGSGWYVYPLPTKFPLSLNGERLTARANLRAGDRLMLGDLVLDVTRLEPAAAAPAKWVGPTCTVTATAGGEAFGAEVSHSPVLVGSSASCDFVLPDTAADPLHALLAYEDNLWHVHDLTGKGLERLSGQLVPSTVAVSGAAVWAGAVELCLTCQPFDRIGAAAVEAAPAPPRSARPTPSVVETAVQKPLRKSVTHQDGFELCNWVKTEMATLYFDADRPVPPSAGGQPPDPRAALAYYQQQLTRHPGDRRLMRDLADRFAESGFADLERTMLQEVLRFHPADVPTLMRLAARLLKSGTRPTRTPEEQRQELERAGRCAGRAASIDPDADGLSDLRERIAVAAALIEIPPAPLKPR